MRNFDFYNPTKILFGKGEIAKISQEIPKDSKVLLLYGGGSIKKNGVYKQVIEALESYDYIEFSGISANPEYSILMDALEVIKKEQITYLLAVGGGSVIDGTKFLSSASLYDGEEPWDILSKKIRTEIGMPFGCVQTLPATGSEMNSGAVISRSETKEKLGMGGPGLFPKFSVLDPEVIHSIPKRQIANGIVDAFTHVLEQYMTFPIGAGLQDRFAESILCNLIELAPAMYSGDFSYQQAADYMWSCTMALNGLIQKGVPTDWAIHAMGHELTVLYGIDHARTLAIIMEPHYRYNFDAKKEKLAQYARRVWGILEGDSHDQAHLAIEKTKGFFKSLDVQLKLSDYSEDYHQAPESIANTFEERGWLGIGEHGTLNPKDVFKIVQNALK